MRAVYHVYEGERQASSVSVHMIAVGVEWCALSWKVKENVVVRVQRVRAYEISVNYIDRHAGHRLLGCNI